MRRVIGVALGVSMGLAGCATAGGQEPAVAYPSTERAVGPEIRPRTIGRPVERLEPAALARVETALQERGLLDPVPLPGEMRDALIALQRENELAPTGWLDEETAGLLGLDVAEVLPLEAGAGSYFGWFSRGGTEQGGMVGGEPGPASMPPTPEELGATVPAGLNDPDFQFREARRMRAAARELRGLASNASGERLEKLERQASKAEHLFAVHAEQLEELGGASALAGLDLEGPAGGTRQTDRQALEEGSEARAAFPAREREEVQLPTERDSVDLSEEEIERMQRALWAEGFLHQAPTGEVDERTRQALRAFQTAQGREPTGALDPASAEELVGAPTADQPQGLEPPGSPQSGGAAPPSPGGEAGSPAGGPEARDDLPAR